MATNPRHAPLDDVVDLMPEHLGEPAVRQRLRKLARELDQLTALDEAGQIVVDRDTVLRAIADPDLFPSQVRDRIKRELEGHLGDKLKGKGSARHLRWREVAAEGNALDPISPAELRKLRIDASSSIQDVRKTIREHFPQIPQSLLDADAQQIRDMAMQALAHNRTVWDCCVAHLGWWATIAVFAAVGAFLIVGTATGPWGIPLAIWLIGVLGGGTGAIVANCVMNPEWGTV